MGSIAGIICLDESKSADKEVVISMLEAMSPGGTSGTRVFSIPDNSAAVGQLVSKCQMKGAEQSSETKKRPIIFCTGEVYNDDAGGSSAEDTLLERYRTLGVENFSNGLNGSFAAVICDPVTKSVILITDHTGSIPIFTIVYEGRLYFASEVKGLMAANELPCRPDPLSVLCLAGLGFFLNRRTLVSNVTQMDYATVWHISEGKLKKWSYWRYIIRVGGGRPKKESRDQLIELLQNAVKRRTRDGKVGILLSGGVDSRGILCCLDDPSKIPVISYTFKTRDTRHQLGDWAIAESVAREMNMDFLVFAGHVHDFRNSLESSVYDSDGAAGFIYQNLIWENMKQRTKVDYLFEGDECMGWTKGFTIRPQVLAEIGVYSLSAMGGLQCLVHKDVRELLIQQSEAEIESILSHCKAQNPYDCVDELYFSQRLFHFINPKWRVISRHGLQIRNPWLDIDILNFIRKQPYRYRIRKGLFREALSELNPSIFRIPRAKETEFDLMDYSKYLIFGERKDNLVSKMIFDNNPLFKELFDTQAINRLIEYICLRGAGIERKLYRSYFLSYRSHFLKLLPKSMVAALRAGKYCFNPPVRNLWGLPLLLGVTTAAVALRQLSRRWGTRSNQKPTSRNRDIKRNKIYLT